MGHKHYSHYQFLVAVLSFFIDGDFFFPGKITKIEMVFVETGNESLELRADNRISVACLIQSPSFTLL